MMTTQLGGISNDDLLAHVRTDLIATPGPIDVPRVARVLSIQGVLPGGADLVRVTEWVRDHLEGLGPLQDLAAPGVTDILVNASGDVWVDDHTGLHSVNRHLGPSTVRELAVRLATAGGRRLDDAVPWADAHLPSGIRLHAVLPPLSPDGPIISLRLPAPEPLSLQQLHQRGMFPPDALTLLERIIDSRIPFLVSGGTGCGKTTLLGAMLALTPDSERIVVVEDARELNIDHPHVVQLQSRHANSEGTGYVGLSALVRHSLRMRPDRIVLGECRGEEVKDLLQALNTGHDGGCGTLHANAAGDVPARLEALASLAGMDRSMVAAQTVSAVRLVLHVSRIGGRRALREVAMLDRDEHGFLRATTAYTMNSERLVAGAAATDCEHALDAAQPPVHVRVDQIDLQRRAA